MAKRFTETRIWEEDWFIALPKDYKFFWFYLKDNCDHAGIWKPNLTIFCRMFRVSIELKEAVKLFNADKPRVLVLENGRILILDFIAFQYGRSLNANNRVHESIIRALENNGVNLTSIRPQLGVNLTPKDKDKDKDIKIVGGMGEGRKRGPKRNCHKCGRLQMTQNEYEAHVCEVAA